MWNFRGGFAFEPCSRTWLRGTGMNRNILFLVIGALAVVSVGLGYALYQERQKTSGVEISVGPGGLSVEKK